MRDSSSERSLEGCATGFSVLRSRAFHSPVSLRI